MTAQIKSLFGIGGGGGEGVAGGFAGFGHPFAVHGGPFLLDLPGEGADGGHHVEGDFHGGAGAIVGQLDGFDGGVPEGLLPALQECRAVFGTQELGCAEAVARNQKAPVLLGPGAEGLGVGAWTMAGGLSA